MSQERIQRSMQEIINSAEVPSQLAGISDIFGLYLPRRVSAREFQARLGDALAVYQGSDRTSVYNALFQVAVEVDAPSMRYPISDLMTGQEHSLQGSSAGNSWEPYKPRLFSQISYPNRDWVNIQRATQESFQVAARYFGLENHGPFVRVSVEPLDESGNTIRDPRPLDRERKPIEHYTKSNDFPFRRG